MGFRIRWSSCKRVGLVYDKSWSEITRCFFTCFERFVIGVFGSEAPLIVVSCYIPDSDQPGSDDTAEELYEQMGRARSVLLARYPKASFCVLLDANVELPAGRLLTCGGEEFAATGEEGTCKRRRWERERGEGGSQQEVKERRKKLTSLLLDFMADHGLKAANTFATRQPTWESWGENRFVTQKRVLDYMLVPYRWQISKVGAQWY